MTPEVQAVLQTWSLPIPLTVGTALVAFLYLTGWRRLHSAPVIVIPVWRTGSFLLGLFLVWAAVGSPLAAFDEQLLTVHMLQHLLLMTIAPALILLGAPVMPLLHGLPRHIVRTILGPVFRWTPVQWVGRLFSQPTFCWVAAAAALVGWHVPAAFLLGLQSEGWHVVEHGCFLGTGFLFWWPVIQPWPSVPVWPRWSILLYLFLATLPCDVLSGFLVFSERVVYPVYFTATHRFGMSVLADQQCAGALMWTCVTIIYLVPAASLTTRLLGVRNQQANDFVQSEQHPNTAPSSDAQSVEVG
jgi:cytochrome c oxidase assembly factor CtaG